MEINKEYAMAILKRLRDTDDERITLISGKDNNQR